MTSLLVYLFVRGLLLLDPQDVFAQSVDGNCGLFRPAGGTQKRQPRTEEGISERRGAKNTVPPRPADNSSAENAQVRQASKRSPDMEKERLSKALGVLAPQAPYNVYSKCYVFV